MGACQRGGAWQNGGDGRIKSELPVTESEMGSTA